MKKAISVITSEVTNFMVAIIFSLRKRRRPYLAIHAQLKRRSEFSQKARVVTAASFLIIAGVIFLGPNISKWYIYNRPDTPRALVDNAEPSSQPATDTFNLGTAATIPDTLKTQLASQLASEQQGTKKDKTPIKELSDFRDENDTVYLDKDGSKSLVHTLQASNYKDKNGNWQNIDVGVEKDNSTGRFITKSNDWQAQFGSTTNDGVHVVKNNQDFSLTPIGASNVAPLSSGTDKNAIITYKNVWKGVDLQYETFGSELKETIVLHDKSAATSYNFSVKGANLTPDSADVGSFKLDGNLSGFSIAAPTVGTYDKGVIGAAPIVTQTLVNGQLHIQLDPNWLAQQPTQSFPVTIDPTVTNYSSTNNAYVSYKSDGFVCNPGQGCGNSAGNVPNTPWRFVYHVDLSAAMGHYVVSATLHLEMPDPDGTHYYGTYDARNFNVYHAACMGFNCIDGSYGEGSGSIASEGDIDVSQIYRHAVQTGDSGSYEIVQGDETANYTSYKLFGYDATSVTINYEDLPSQSTIAAPSPADSGTTITTQPTLASTVPTDDDGPGPIQYRYFLATSKGAVSTDPYHTTPGLSGIVADSGLTSQPEWTVPDNILQDGTTYYWQAATWDSYSGAPLVYGPVYSFKVDLRNGNNDNTQAQDTFGPTSVDFATGNLSTGISSHTMTALAGNMGVNLDYNSPQRSQQGLVGQYWNTSTGTSVPAALTKIDPNINFNWGTGSPSAGIIGADNFTAHWTGYMVAPYTGTYTFGCEGDDTVRVQVNNQMMVDTTSNGCYNTIHWGSATMSLTAGQIVPFYSDMTELTGTAYTQVYAQVTNGGSTVFAGNIIPATWFQTGTRPIAADHGLLGQYYTDDGTHNFPTDPNDPTREFLTRTDTSMNLNWGSGSPVPNGPTDNFMVRWTGYFTAPTSDTYTFGSSADDGVRVMVNGSTVVNSWVGQAAGLVTYASSGISLTAGQTIPIEVDYFEISGLASMGLYVKQASLPSAPDTIVNSSWLSPKAHILPDGWNLGIDADGDVAYDYAVISQDSVILHDSTGETHEYKFANGGFTPPVNEDGQMVRNGDGSINFQDSDGRTYIFNSDGTLRSSSQAVDDAHPAALQYTYSGTPAHLTQITDGVSTSRWMKLLYSGDSNCPIVPSGFGSVPTNMICAVTSSDNNTTQLVYSTDGKLARFIKPGNDITDYGYDTSGRITQIRSDLANDAIAAGKRSQDGTELTQVAYDALGRVLSVTLPAANPGDSRQVHSFEYQSGYTNLHTANLTEPYGFTRKVTYDSSDRTLTDTDVANLTTTNVWDTDPVTGSPRKDLLLSSTDPIGLESTTIYDYADRPTDQYGPAPSSWFGSNRLPITSPTDYTSQIPHQQTSYDSTINGLAVAYYTVKTATNGTGSSTRLLAGNPKGHATGVGGTSGDINQTWNAAAPMTADPTDGWGARLTGDIHLTTNGTYNFRLYSDDGVRLWIDDTLIIDDWNDGAQRSHPIGTFVNSNGDSWHRIKIDYYNQPYASNAMLQLFMTSPGGTETSSLGSLLKPHYGLTTSQTTYDSSSSVGNETTTSNYGPNPELGLVQSTTSDPAGLNYTSTNSYEAPGTGTFLRQLSSTLPGGASTSYAYYSATDTAANPCVSGSPSVLQGGLVHLKTDPNPNGTGGSGSGRVTEDIYDASGRIVASRYNSDPWTCTTYDARGRETQVSVPNLGANQPAITTTNNWSVGGNPLATSTGDASGTITTTTDLLGRTTTYQDARGATTTTSYDNVGRVSERVSPAGTQTYSYDQYGRLSSQSLGGTVLATPSYDAYGRLSGVTYPTAGSLSVAIGYDTFGHDNSINYTLGNGTTHLSDSVNYSQSGKIISGTNLGSSETYSYDALDRLTAATLGSNSYSYGYGTPTICTGTYNANAGKDSDRTTQTVNGVTTNYCYNYADQLISSSNSLTNAAVYDAHGNMVQIGSGGSQTNFPVDAEDRSRGIEQYASSAGNGFAYYYTIDAQGRIIARYKNSITNWNWAGTTSNAYDFTDSSDSPAYATDMNGNITEKYQDLPGGVTLTIRPNSTSPSDNILSLPNIHGDVMATTDHSGAQTGTYQYDPFGELTGASIPNNTVMDSTYGMEGSHEKISETAFTLAPVQMGARVYIPSIGRFAGMDILKGGNANPYIYPADPINFADLTGQKGIQGGKGNQPTRAQIQAAEDRARGVGNYDRKLYKQYLQKVKSIEKFDGSRASRISKDIIKNTGKGLDIIFYIIVPPNIIKGLQYGPGGPVKA